MNLFKEKVKVIIFGTDTAAGKSFDLILITAIVTSVLIVMLDSVASYSQQFGEIFNYLEWSFTILFTCRIPLEDILYKKSRKLYF